MRQYFLNGRAGISPEMAVRLLIAFDNSAEIWLNQQQTQGQHIGNAKYSKLNRGQLRN